MGEPETVEEAVALAYEELANIREIKHKLIGAQISHMRGLMIVRQTERCRVRCATPVTSDNRRLDGAKLHRRYVECSLSIDDCMMREKMILDGLRKAGVPELRP